MKPKRNIFTKNYKVLFLINIFILFAKNTYSNEVNSTFETNTNLSDAAVNAANAAVNAANSAAIAANAAAAAASAAVDAMNAILPSKNLTLNPQQNSISTPKPTQLITPNSLSAQKDGIITKPLSENKPLNLAAPKDLLLDKSNIVADDVLTFPQAAIYDDELIQTNADEISKGLIGQFKIPSEQSLTSLIGQYDVEVGVDARQNFMQGIAGFTSGDANQVQIVNSLDLSQAVKASMGFSRDVLIASARMDQAKAQTGQARAFMLPSLLVNHKAGNEISRPGSQIDPITGREVTKSNHYRRDTIITLKQPLFDMPGMYDYQRRQVIEESRAEGVRASEGDAYLATVNAYLSLASTRLQANIAIDYENQLKELFEYIEKRATAGAASNSDKERVRARSLSARSSRVEQEAANAAAGVELARLINIAPSSLHIPELEDLGASVVPKTLEEAMPIAINANPDIATLKSELKAADIDKNVATSKLLPRFDLEYTDSNILHAGGQLDGQADQRLMMVMNWSMFNGGSDLKLRDEKSARYMELSYRLDDQQRKVIQSLSAQYATLEATRSRISDGYRELTSIATAASAMSARMVSGNQSLLDMLDVYDRYYQARTRLVGLHIQEMTATAQIARLVQGMPNIESLASIATPSKALN